MVTNEPITNISVTKHPPPPNGGATIAESGSVAVVGRGSGTGAATATADGKATGTLSVSGTLAVTGNISVVGIIESEFLRKFREKFFGKPGEEQPWPTTELMMDNKRLAEEFTDAFRTLFLLREEFDPPAADGADGSAKKLIKQLIDDTGWPLFNEKVPVPEPWSASDKRDRFRRYEVSAAMDIMMRAFHCKGTGGGGETTGLPPDR